MLESLEQVDWKRLQHAYGSARDVPAALRDLRDPDADVRNRAFGGLFSTIFHQGSRYRASAPAVPFLCELLGAADTPDRARIIQLLEHLAVGHPVAHLQRGFYPEKAFARAARLGRNTDLDALRAAEPDEEDDWEPGRQNLWARDAYEAVLARIELLQRLTGDPDPSVRIEAVRALGWFPAAAPASIGRVRALARSAVAPEEQIVALPCLALLGHYLRDRSDVAWLRAQLAPERPYVVRVTAAFSLSILPRALTPEAIDLLLGTLQHPQAARAAGAGASWRWEGLLSEIVEVIRRIRPKPTESVVSGLCQAAERVDDSMSGVDVFYTLLAVTFPPPRALPLGRDARGLPYLDPASLTPTRRRALQAIGRSPVWRREPFQYGRLMDLGLEYGLPWRPDAFAEYLAAVQSLPELPDPD